MYEDKTDSQEMARALKALEQENQALKAKLARQEAAQCELDQTQRQLQTVHEESVRQRSEITALLDSARAVLKNQTFEQAARCIFDLCKDLIGATAGYVALLSEDGAENEVLFLDAGGLPCTVDPSLPMPIRGLRERSYRLGEAVYDNDFMNSQWMEFMPAGHVRLDNVMFSPLVIAEKTVGLIGLANKPEGFTPNDARMAAAFGEIAAIALKNSRDLEERLRAEDALAQSKRLLERTLNSLKDAVFVIDAQSVCILACNQAATKIFGYDKAEMIGKATRFLYMDEQSLRKFRKRLYPAVEQKGFLEIQGFVMQRKDGSRFPADITTSPLEDEAGSLIGWVSVIQDSSQRRQLEEQLRQSQKMEAMGTLAGGIAHDFNNLLFPIIGYAELLGEEFEQGTPSHEFINEILQATERARELVEQILTFGRQTPKSLKPLTLHSIVKEALKLLRASLPAFIEIQQDVGECGPIMADPTHIHQVMMNLCTNAYHAMRGNGGVLTVELGEVDLAAGDIALISGFPPGPYLRLSVADTGKGMDETIAKRVFEPYFTTKKKGEGTGLGLAVVDGIVKEHHGFIQVESQPGKGSRFTVFFPRIAEDASESTPAESDAVPQGQGHLLLVDDEAPNTRMLAMLLKRLGYAVTPETDSLEALKRFQANPGDFDLMITDMTMPRMTGADLAQKALALRPDLPIILITGFSELIDAEEAARIGIRKYMSKPLSISALAQAIERLLTV